MQVIITILDNITETSMPFNEFVVYRGFHYKEQLQYLIIHGRQGELPQIEIPKNIKIIYTGKSPLKIRNTLKDIIGKCKKENAEFIIHMHHVKSALLTFVSMLGTGFRKKALFTVHNTFTGYSFHNKVLSFLNALFAARITCVSSASYESYPELIKKIKGERIKGVENGVDTERIDSVLKGISRGERKDSSVKLVYVARMVPVKNHKFLIDLMKELPAEYQLILVGAEDAAGETRKQAVEAGVIDRVTFTGLIPRIEVFKILYEADIYVSPSTLEGLPISVLEAMYCQLPVILSDIKPHKEVAKNAKPEDEFIGVFSLDRRYWKDRITGLAERMKYREGELGKASRQYVASEFSLRRMHENYDKIYEKLFKSGN